MDDPEEILALVKNESVAVDALFDALRAERRRYVLAALQTNESAMALADLAYEVAKREQDDATPNPETVTRVYASLYHRHIPKLEDTNIIGYEQETQIVRLKS